MDREKQLLNLMKNYKKYFENPIDKKFTKNWDKFIDSLKKKQFFDFMALQDILNKRIEYILAEAELKGIKLVSEDLRTKK